MYVNKNWVRYACSPHNLPNHEFFRNSLTLLKEINNSIFIVFKHSYVLKYWFCDIINVCKRISSTFYIFPLFFIFLWLKNLEFLKDFKIWKISKFWRKKTWTFTNNSENLKKKEKILKFLKTKIWKSRRFWKQKSENLTKSRKFWKQSRNRKSNFLFFIEQNIFCQDCKNKLFWSLLYV